VSSAGMGENEAYLDRQSGKIYWHSEFGYNDEELHDDIDDEKYIAIPNKIELDGLARSAPGFRPPPRSRKSSSHPTRRWRKADSNSRSHRERKRRGKPSQAISRCRT
jgi:hypothetical protein